MTGPEDDPISVNQPLAAFKVLAFYRFAQLPDCADLKPLLAAFCCARRIRGTFILAPEGINGTVAGTPAAIDALLAWFAGDPVWAARLAGAEAKVSWAETMPFLRMKVRLKPEIVTLRAPEADPSRRVGTYVDPADWNRLIARNDVVLVDTRNDYEVKLGTFASAIDPGTENFTQFKDFVATRLDPRRDRKVAMFCTGGIRCEKASSYLLAQGFEEVFHLKGGILKYLEAVPEAESRFAGECFVFDERVAVTHGLGQGNARLCRGCRMPHAPEALDDGLCPACLATRPDHKRERDRQMALSAARGEAHLGDDATRTAERNRALKAERRQRSRTKN